MDQHGFPTLFITITENKWHFPKHSHFQDYCQTTFSPPCHNAFAETMFIVHSLRQLCSQFICGSLTRFNTHILRDCRHPSVNNVKTFFYRIEFQRRGTPHVHLLVWLKHVNNLNLQNFSAHVPQQNLAFNVETPQQSTGTLSNFLQVSEEPNTVNSQTNALLLLHTQLDHQLGIRAHIPSINYALRSHMDIQSSDGYDMLLTYVSSYATKMHDDHIAENFYGSNVMQPSAT